MSRAHLHGARLRIMLKTDGLVFGAMIIGTSSISAEDTLDQRARVMTDMGRALRIVVTEMRRSNADTVRLALNIEVLFGNAPLLDDLFVANVVPPGSEASPEIWTAPEAFAKATKALRIAATELSTVDVADNTQIKQGVRRVSAACSHCHQRFRISGN